MDNDTFVKWLKESRAISTLADNRSRVLFIDKAPGHRSSPQVCEALNNVRTTLKRLPANTTEQTQPLDQFFIKLINGL